jgi:GTP-binding protein Era
MDSQSMDTTTEKSFRSAFVALVGRPNSGKSSILNNILKENLSIVTPLPQTTRKNMRGIYTTDTMQIIFVDTPGVHKGKHALNKAMLSEVKEMLDEGGIDCIGYVVDCSREFGSEEDAVAEIVGKQSANKIIIFNKIDIAKNTDKITTAFFEKFTSLKETPFIKISALDPNSGEQVLKCLDPFIHEGPRFYDPDELTDASLRFFASEYLRKYIILNTKEEVPHAALVEIESYKETPEKHEIIATIHVETNGQKGIVIGKQGEGIEKIKKGARMEMKKLVGCPVSLTCHVKVSPGWRDNDSFLKLMGLPVKRK